jgi:hypothetical protein
VEVGELERLVVDQQEDALLRVQQCIEPGLRGHGDRVSSASALTGSAGRSVDHGGQIGL